MSQRVIMKLAGKVNLEIYAERQNNPAAREAYLELARGESQSSEREISTSRGLMR